MITDRKITPSEKVKQEFDHLFAIRQKKKRDNELKQIFHLSNDFVTYGEIPHSIKAKHAAKLNKYLSEHKEVHPVNMMVGDGHYLSFAMSDVPGDIIILDNKKELLEHIIAVHTFLLQKYQEYLEKECSFSQVKSQYFYFLEKEHPTLSLFLNQHMNLMPYHWLYSEENYQRAMESFSERNLLTININLFDPLETVALAKTLKKNNCVVTYFNMTNLPDYDKSDNLSEYFLKVLPLPQDKEACLLQWNVHDDGIFKGIYDHYLSYSNGCEGYDYFFRESFPAYLAQKDFYNLLTGTVQTEAMWKSLEKYQLHDLFKSYEKVHLGYIHSVTHEKFRKKYFAEVEKIQAEFKKDCEETQRTIQQMSKPFAKKLELELNASRFFHIDKGHWRSLLIIYEHLKKYSVKLSPHFIYFLKLDSGLASSIEVLCKPPCDAFSIERIEMAVFSHILLEKTIQPRVKGYLREIIGEEHFEHFKQQLTQGYHAAHVDALRAMLGPLLRPKPVRPKQTMFAPLEVPEEKVEERASCLIL